MLARDDLPACDLLLLAGTSLQVFPFAGLVHEVGAACPRVLVNRDRVGDSGGGGMPSLQAYMGQKRGVLDFGAKMSLFSGGSGRE